MSLLEGLKVGFGGGGKALGAQTILMYLKPGHIKVFNARKQTDLKVNSGSLHVTQILQIRRLPFRKLPEKIVDW